MTDDSQTGAWPLGNDGVKGPEGVVTTGLPEAQAMCRRVDSGAWVPGEVRTERAEAPSAEGGARAEGHEEPEADGGKGWGDHGAEGGAERAEPKTGEELDPMLVDERIRDTRREEEKHKQEERVRGLTPMGPDGKSGETTMPKEGQSRWNPELAEKGVWNPELMEEEREREPTPLEGSA